MWTIVVILALLPFKPDVNSPSYTLDKILSKHYSLTYSAETQRFLPFDSVGNLVTQKGFINRDENHLVSKSDSCIVILEDSTCFDMDNSLRSMTIGPKSLIGTVLIQPAWDPYEIVNYAISNKMGFQKYVEDGKLTYHFLSVEQNPLIYNIVLSFYNDHTDSFSIKFSYQQSPFFKQDIVRYRFVTPPSEPTYDQIADFLDIKNGKYEPKEPYKRFFFVNAFLLLKKK